MNVPAHSFHYLGLYGLGRHASKRRRRLVLQNVAAILGVVALVAALCAVGGIA